MPDWGAVEAIAAVVGVLVASLALFLDIRRRRRTVRVEPRFDGILRQLPRPERRLLTLVDKLSAELAAHYAKAPPNSPMNTNENSEAAARVLDQLQESALMKALGIKSVNEFRVIGQNLARLGLVDYGADETWPGSPAMMFTTELGSALASACLRAPGAMSSWFGPKSGRLRPRSS